MYVKDGIGRRDRERRILNIWLTSASLGWAGQDQGPGAQNSRSLGHCLLSALEHLQEAELEAGTLMQNVMFQAAVGDSSFNTHSLYSL